MPRKQRFRPNRKPKPANEEPLGQVDDRARPAADIVAEIDADATATAEAATDALRAVALQNAMITVISTEGDPAVALSALTGLTRYVIERTGITVERYAQALLSAADGGEPGPPRA